MIVLLYIIMSDSAKTHLKDGLDWYEQWLRKSRDTLDGLACIHMVWYHHLPIKSVKLQDF